MRPASRDRSYRREDSGRDREREWLREKERHGQERNSDRDRKIGGG